MNSAHVHDDSHLLPRRTSALLLIVCLHAVLICALAAGFGHTPIEAPPTVTSAEVLSEPHHTPVPSVQLPPSLQGSGNVVIPTPLFPIYVPTDPSPTNPVDDASQGPLAPSSPARVRELGGPGKGFPDTNDYYPASAIRLGEMGVATVRVCVDVNGRLTSDPAIAHSAGSPRLDEGALRLARAGSGRYRATTEDGRPVDSCYSFQIRFRIRD